MSQNENAGSYSSSSLHLLSTSMLISTGLKETRFLPTVGVNSFSTYTHQHRLFLLFLIWNVFTLPWPHSLSLWFRFLQWYMMLEFFFMCLLAICLSPYENFMFISSLLRLFFPGEKHSEFLWQPVMGKFLVSLSLGIQSLLLGAIPKMPGILYHRGFLGLSNKYFVSMAFMS